jgi:hypothetical protein
VHGGQRVLQRGRRVEIVVAVFRRGEPLGLSAPIGVLLGVPDVLAPEGEAVGFQAHRLIGHVAREQDQVRPAQRVAVLLLHRPQQAARLVEVAVVRPRVQGRESDVASAAAATTIGQTVRPGGVPGEADHQPAVMAVIGGPPILALGQKRLHISLDRFEIQRLHGLAVVEITQRADLGVMLVQDVEVQGLRPPMRDLVALRRQRAVHYRASAARRSVVAVHHVSSPLLDMVAAGSGGALALSWHEHAPGDSPR